MLATGIKRDVAERVHHLDPGGQFREHGAVQAVLLQGLFAMGLIGDMKEGTIQDVFLCEEAAQCGKVL